jgi:hypothetical protein
MFLHRFDPPVPTELVVPAELPAADPPALPPELPADPPLEPPTTPTAALSEPERSIKGKYRCNRR